MQLQQELKQQIEKITKKERRFHSIRAVGVFKVLESKGNKTYRHLWLKIPCYVN